MLACRCPHLDTTALLPVLLALVIGSIAVTPPVAEAQQVTHISADSTLTFAGGPYTLVGVIIVDEGVTLTIEPGVWIRAAQDAMLIVEGNLICVGEPGNTIVFQTLLIPNRWGGIGLYDTGDTAVIQHTRFYRTQPTTYQGYDLSGVVSAYDSDVLITDCEFEDDYFGNGVLLRRSTGLVARNYFVNFGGQVVTAVYCDVDVIDNEFEPVDNTAADVIEFGRNTGPVEIRGNIIHGTFDDGIDVDNQFTGSISNNFIHGCADKGISVGDTSTVYMANNIIWDCARGIVVANSAVAELWNNTITDCFWGLRVQESDVGHGHASATGSNNLIYGNTNSIFVEAGGSSLDLTYSCVQGDPVYPGTGNINGDPLFVDPSNGNFHIGDGSSCIDAGLGTGHPLLDFDGEGRVDDLWVPDSGAGDTTYVDIGADEFQPDPAAIGPVAAPGRPTLFRIRPNPVRAGGQIRLETPAAVIGQVRLFDVQGRLLRGWSGVRAPGSLRFDGRDARGRRLAEGVYFLELVDGTGPADARWTTRLVIVR
jgi:hypothetical protein